MPICRIADTVRNIEADGWRELLHGIGNIIHVSIRCLPYFRFSGSYPDSALITADRHIPGIRHNGKKLNFETRRHLDIRNNVFPDIGCETCVLRDNLTLATACTLEIT